MGVSLKPLNEQVMVITGATSGIGLTTARMAAKQGVKLVLAARSADDLRRLEQEISAVGGKVEVQEADVGDEADVRRIGDLAMRRFGRIDTWVNNAGGSIVGRLEEVSDADSRRLFETTFWGMVNGSREALRHLKARGGALINLGSVASDRAFPLQGMYCAAKHAVKGFTDTLRMELDEEGAPVSVTLIKPAAIDTPFAQHAKNYMKEEAVLPPPLYAPEEVAKAILHAATHPVRDIFVGGAAKVLSSSGHVAPRMTDKVMEHTMFEQQKGDRPARDREGALHRPGGGLSQRGNYEGHVMESSLYTRASMHPWVTGLLLGAAGVAVAGMLGMRENGGQRSENRPWRRVEI